MSQSKLFEDIFALFMFGHFFRKGEGFPIPNFWRNFSP